MVLKIYGMPQSTCVKRVAVVCKLKNIEYEFYTIDMMSREHKTTAYLEKQPFGQIPYVDDDGLILYESRAICRYLAAKYANQGVPLTPAPSDLKASAFFEIAVSIESANFDPSVSGVVGQRLLAKLRGLETDEVRAAEHVNTLELKLAGYEAILSKQNYLGGDSLTLADIFHLPYGSLLTKAGVDLLESNQFPHVSKWWKGLLALPAWQEVTGGVGI